MRWFLFNNWFEQKPLFFVVRRCQSSVWGFNVVNDALWRKNFNRASSQQSNWYFAFILASWPSSSEILKSDSLNKLWCWNLKWPCQYWNTQCTTMKVQRVLRGSHADGSVNIMWSGRPSPGLASPQGTRQVPHCRTISNPTTTLTSIAFMHFWSSSLECFQQPFKFRVNANALTRS